MFALLSDVNECVNSTCDSNATCTNTIGSFLCNCNYGLSGDGTYCVGEYLGPFFLMLSHLVLWFWLSISVLLWYACGHASYFCPVFN